LKFGIYIYQLETLSQTTAELRYMHYNRGATSSLFRGDNYHETSFDDVIRLIQPWYNFFANSHR